MSTQIPDSPGIPLTAGAVRFFLGHAYQGTPQGDALLRSAVLADGGPAWIREARVEQFGAGVRLLPPR